VGDLAMSSTPDAAIVIVNYRSAALVEQCLASVAESSGRLRFETVIVDNDSGDGSVERLSRSLPEANVIAMHANRGFAAGVNAGFANSRADPVILLNPDTEVRAGAIEQLLARLREHPRAGVVAPLLEDDEGGLMSSGMRRFPNLLTMALAFSVPASYGFVYLPFRHFEAMSGEDHLAGRAPAHVCGAALAIRRGAYEQAGPFDEGFFLYLEETEWQGRVTAAGWNIELVPGARVCHLVRGGGQEALAPSPYVVKSALRYLRLKGVPVWLARAVLGLSIMSSVVTLRLIACLPSKRAHATWQAHAYQSLLRELR
jgi:N-acetylglucosaminyl-diphospho-decaprenol L-rhamnosyltransferase